MPGDRIAAVLDHRLRALIGLLDLRVDARRHRAVDRPLVDLDRRRQFDRTAERERQRRRKLYPSPGFDEVILLLTPSYRASSDAAMPAVKICARPERSFGKIAKIAQ